MRPRIGITAYWLEASWGPWTGMPACLAPQAYTNAIMHAGIPVHGPHDASSQ